MGITTWCFEFPYDIDTAKKVLGGLIYEFPDHVLTGLSCCVDNRSGSKCVIIQASFDQTASASYDLIEMKKWLRTLGKQLEEPWETVLNRCMKEGWNMLIGGASPELIGGLFVEMKPTN
jgi:hypothetical protein